MLNNLLLGFALVTSVMGASDANSREEEQQHLRPLDFLEGCKVQLFSNDFDFPWQGPARGTIIDVNYPEGTVSVRFDDNTVQRDLPRDWVVEVLPVEEYKIAEIGDVGSKIMVLSPTQVWRSSEIIEKEEDRIKIHYSGFDAKHDEWISNDSYRLKTVFSPAHMEELTVKILQYAMYDAEAIDNHTTDPAHGIAYLYRAGRFVRVGVEVTGAGTTRLNGWYRRREASEGPPRCYSEVITCQEWVQDTEGRPWYEKDGCCIYWEEDDEMWEFASEHDTCVFYSVNSDALVPPAGGWSCESGIGDAPAPTLRMVS